MIDNVKRVHLVSNAMKKLLITSSEWESFRTTFEIPTEYGTENTKDCCIYIPLRKPIYK